MTIALNEHPLNKWYLKKDSKYFGFSSLSELPNLLPTIQSLPDNEQIVLANQVLDVINTHFEIYLKERNNTQYYNDHMVTPDKCTNRITSVINFYHHVAQLNIEQNKLNWSYFLFNKLDQFYEGQKIIDLLKDKIDNKKHFGKHFKKYGHSLTIENLIDISNTVLTYNYDNFSDKISYFTSQIERYGQKIDWSSLLEKKPSLLIAILAVKDSYQLKEKEFLNIFNATYKYINTHGSEFHDVNFSLLSDTYLQLLTNNKFFIHTLAPQADMKKAMTAFLKTTYTETSPTKAQNFANNILNYKHLEYIRLDLIVQQKQNIQVLGKKYVTPEEQEHVNEVIAATKNVSPKKTKI